MNIQILQPHQYIHFCVLQSSQVCSCCTRWLFEWVTSVSAYVKYCLVYVGKVFPLEPDPFHSHWFSDKFSFLHNRVGEMTQKWPKQLTAFTSASKENKRWEVTCSDIVAWFVQWENAGGGWLDEQTEVKPGMSSCQQPDPPDAHHRTDTCAQKCCATQEGIHEHLRERTDVGMGQ